MENWIELILIIHDFRISEFIYSLKFICNTKGNICSIFIIIINVCRGAKNKSWRYMNSQLRYNRVTICLLDSTLLQRWPEDEDCREHSNAGQEVPTLGLAVCGLNLNSDVAKTTKASINNWVDIKLKSFSRAKEVSKKIKKET